MGTPHSPVPLQVIDASLFRHICFLFFLMGEGGGVAKDNDEQFEIDVINMLSSSFDFF